MGFCSRRHLFLSICVIQVISMVQRQVFDFLGTLWIPILVNFFEIIFIIFGFFGAYQYRPKYIIAYLLWHLFWIAWNIFVICLYLNVAGLDHETNTVLKLDPTSDSWWKKEGPSCRIVNVDEIPLRYEGCLINYIHVEIFQAGLQCILAVFNSVIGICLSRMFLEEDDTFNFEKADGPDNFLLHPMYVSSSDKLHSSNKHLNFKPYKLSAVPNMNKQFNNEYARFTRTNRHAHVDTIRVPLARRNSFSTLATINKKRSVRPKSIHALES